MSLLRLLLAVLLLVSAGPVLASDPFEPLPESALRQAATRAYLPEELAGFSGVDPAKPLLMAIRGIVFDVSESARFYGPGAPYNALIARDVTRAVALMSLDDEHMTDRCDGLPTEAVERLNAVLRDTYLPKYPISGHLKGGAFYPHGLCCTGLRCQGCPAD